KKKAIYKKYYFNGRISSLNPPQSDKDDQFRKNVYVGLNNELNVVVHYIDYLSAGKIKGNIRRWLYKQNKNKKNEDQYQHQHDTDSLNEQQLLLNVAANENILTIDEHELTDRQLEENSDSSENEEEDCFVDNNIISTNTQHREKIRSRAARYIKDIQSLLLSDSLEIYQMNLIGKKKEWDALFIKYFDRSIEKRIKQF
ncbi:unnamed protein product, partial [Didymodactylos carnosus]